VKRRRPTTARLDVASLGDAFWRDDFVRESAEPLDLVNEYGRYTGPPTITVRVASMPMLEDLMKRTWKVPRLSDVVSDDGDSRGWQHVENMRRNLVLWLPRPSERKDPRRLLRVLLSAGQGLNFDWSRFDPEEYSSYAAAGTATPGTELWYAPRLPPIVLDGGEFVDGRHRILAADRAGLVGLPAIDLQDLGVIRARGSSSSSVTVVWPR
jgi:hypothetical protein